IVAICPRPNSAGAQCGRSRKAARYRSAAWSGLPANWASLALSMKSWRDSAGIPHPAVARRNKNGIRPRNFVLSSNRLESRLPIITRFSETSKRESWEFILSRNWISCGVGQTGSERGKESSKQEQRLSLPQKIHQPSPRKLRCTGRGGLVIELFPFYQRPDHTSRRTLNRTTQSFRSVASAQTGSDALLAEHC